MDVLLIRLPNPRMVTGETSVLFGYLNTKCPNRTDVPLYSIVEHWFDVELELLCRTVFYSTLNIENWEEDQHRQYITRNKLLEGQAKKYKGSGLGIRIIEDNSGNLIWSVTAVLDDDDYL